jgi:hypothetical protein
LSARASATARSSVSAWPAAQAAANACGPASSRAALYPRDLAAQIASREACAEPLEQAQAAWIISSCT